MQQPAQQLAQQPSIKTVTDQDMMKMVLDRYEFQQRAAQVSQMVHQAQVAAQHNLQNDLQNVAPRHVVSRVPETSPRYEYFDDDREQVIPEVRNDDVSSPIDQIFKFCGFDDADTVASHVAPHQSYGQYVARGPPTQHVAPQHVAPDHHIGATQRRLTGPLKMVYYKAIVDLQVSDKAPYRAKIQLLEQIAPSRVPMQLSAAERTELNNYLDEMFATGRHLLLNFKHQLELAQAALQTKTKTVEQVCKRICAQSYTENIVGLFKCVGQYAGVENELGFGAFATPTAK